jgi:hypothetical protein
VAELFEQNQDQRHVTELAEKQAGQNSRLASIVRQLREQISKKDRRWVNAAKELKHLVETTGGKDWETNIRKLSASPHSSPASAY